MLLIFPLISSFALLFSAAVSWDSFSYSLTLCTPAFFPLCHDPVFLDYTYSGSELSPGQGIISANVLCLLNLICSISKPLDSYTYLLYYYRNMPLLWIMNKLPLLSIKHFISAFYPYSLSNHAYAEWNCFHPQIKIRGTSICNTRFQNHYFKSRYDNELLYCFQFLSSCNCIMYWSPELGCLPPYPPLTVFFP